MNYLRIHDFIIDRAQNRIIEGYVERHHIIPKCLGGSNSKDNIVRLTGKEHYIIHLLLLHIYPNSKKLMHAFWMMSNKMRIKSGKMYKEIRAKISL